MLRIRDLMARETGDAKRFLLQWLGFFAATMALWLPFLARHMCSDGYVIAISQKVLIAQSSANGRPLSSLAVWLAQVVGFNLASNHLLSVMIGLVVFSLATTVLFRLLKGVLPALPELFVAAAAFLVVNNPFVVEFYYFQFYLFAFALQLLLSLLAVGQFIEATKDGWRWNIIVRSLALLVAGMMFFQSWTGIFLVLAFMAGIHARRGLAMTVKAMSLAVSLFLVAVVIDYSYIRLVHPVLFPFAVDYRTLGFDFLGSLRDLISSMPGLLINAWGFLPPWFWLAICSVPLFLMAVGNTSWRKKREVLVLAVALWVMMVVLAVSPQIFLDRVWFSGRSLALLGACPAMLLAFVLSAVRQGPIARFVAAMFLCGLFLFQAVMVHQAAADVRGVYSLDSELAGQWARSIRECEKKSGAAVNRVYFHDDAAVDYCYRQYPCRGDFNVRVTAQEFFRVSMLASVMERPLNLHDLDGYLAEADQPLPEAKIRQWTGVMNEEDYQGLFGAAADWQHFSPEQVRCEGAAAYIAVY